MSDAYISKRFVLGRAIGFQVPASLQGLISFAHSPRTPVLALLPLVGRCLMPVSLQRQLWVLSQRSAEWLLERNHTAQRLVSPSGIIHLTLTIKPAFIILRLAACPASVSE